MPSSHFHGLDAGSVTVLIRDYLAWNRRVFATVVTFLYGGTTATTNELRNCCGCVKEVPRITHGLLRLCYEFAKVMLRYCRKWHVVKPRLHYGVNGTQPQHIRGLSGAFRGTSWPVSDHGPDRDMLRICCDCVTAIYGFLRSLTVDYWRNEIFEHVENRATEKTKWRNIPENHGHV